MIWFALGIIVGILIERWLLKHASDLATTNAYLKSLHGYMGALSAKQDSTTKYMTALGRHMVNYTTQSQAVEAKLRVPFVLPGSHN